VDLLKEGIVAGEEIAHLGGDGFATQESAPVVLSDGGLIGEGWDGFYDILELFAISIDLYLGLIDVQNDCSGCLTMVKHTTVNRTSHEIFLHFAFIVHQL
jgi:hypothetical protein